MALLGFHYSHVCAVLSPPRPGTDAAPGGLSPARAAGEWTRRVRSLQRRGRPVHGGRVRLAPLRDGLEAEEGAVLPRGQKASGLH